MKGQMLLSVCNFSLQQLFKFMTNKSPVSLWLDPAIEVNRHFFENEYGDL